MLQMPKRSLCDLVLDTIDIISARKNRPNLVRIYRHLHRLYDLSLSTCESLLQSLLKEGRVIRVTYKGNISYRNALKWKKYSYYMKKTMGSELPGTILTKAISELVVQEPDYLNMGVPCKILEEHLLSMKDYNISKETIHNLLQRELKHESLLQLDNGNYFLGPKPPDTPLFEGEEVDLKFDKVKKVKTYKHEIKRLKDKAIENMNSSNFILQNNNVPESYKELSDLEVNHSDIATDLKGLDNQTAIDEISCIDSKQNRIVIDDNSSNQTITKTGTESVQFEDCRMTTSENGITSNEETHCSTKKLPKELQFRPLEELVERELSSSQVMDSEPSDLNDSDKDPVKRQCSNLGSEERLSLESSDDSFSLSVSDAETTSNFNLERNLSCDVTESSKDAKLKKSKYKPSSSQDEYEINSEDMSYSKHKSSSCKVDSDSNDQKNGISVDKIKNKDKSFPPVVERVQRKKRTKYDASEYYFPSLKRKTRESTSDNDKKEDKRRKKRKKDGVGCLSGIFAKRVMFPGNTSMCCECNCYISKVKLDPMIFCTTCANQGHQSCALKTMSGKDWFCVGCRTEATLPTCTVCNKMADQEDRGILHSCTRCGDRYHKECHSLAIKVPLPNEWHCFKCLIVETKGMDESSKNDEKTDSDSCGNQEFKNENKPSNTQFLKEEPPDSRNWSSEDVYNYFKEYLDEEAANAFMEQDIDGYALKLMGRSDVLNLGLKLGPSLKVLFHVRRLQLRSNRLMEIWNN
ncbi:unnamed protein product [Nezara viridula]|uniref:Uncharacterized protein n=1 Tax=Nezara viridula TaxID=85310 RepID=A0A9P0H5D3_NEZVI|nr:unnamed protein product [Nezara viridula]